MPSSCGAVCMQFRSFLSTPNMTTYFVEHLQATRQCPIPLSYTKPSHANFCLHGARVVVEWINCCARLWKAPSTVFANLPIITTPIHEILNFVTPRGIPKPSRIKHGITRECSHPVVLPLNGSLVASLLRFPSPVLLRLSKRASPTPTFCLHLRHS